MGSAAVAGGPVAATGDGGLVGKDGEAGNAPAGSAPDGADEVPTGGAGPDVGVPLALEVALDGSPSPCETAILGRVGRCARVGASPLITESGSDDRPIR